MYPKSSCVPLISSHRNFSVWNFTTNYGHYFQLLSCIFFNSLLWSHSVSGNVLALAVWCVGVCVIPWCYLLSPTQGFRLICFSIWFLRAIQSPLPAWGCSCMLISQFQQNTHRSLLKYLVFLIQREEVFWAGRGEEGRVWARCCFLFLLSSGRWRFFSWDTALMLEMQLCHIIISNF